MGRKKVQLDPAEPCTNPRHEAFAQLVARDEMTLQDCYLQVFGGPWTPGRQVQSSVLAKRLMPRIAHLKQERAVAVPVVDPSDTEVTNATLHALHERCLSVLVHCATVSEEIGERELASKLRGMVSVTATRRMLKEAPAAVDHGSGRDAWDAALSRFLRVETCQCPRHD